jgi:hypothetical protein
VDLPVSGKRERDPRNGFHTPYSPNWRNSKDVIFKPAWALDMLRNGLPGMANMEGYRFSAAAGTDIVTAVGREMDAGLDWEYIKRLRQQWPGKLLLKGVERPDDAERAVSVGCDGVVVSNHGGRQLDRRRFYSGSLTGRWYVPSVLVLRYFSMAAYAAAWTSSRRARSARRRCSRDAPRSSARWRAAMRGAKRALEILSSELVRAMQLCGVRSIDEIGRSCSRSGPDSLVVHLVDGTYELFRHFYGQRRWNKGKDAPFGAVNGVLHTMLQMIEKGATHLGVATDHVIESFRNGLWPGYKTAEGVEPALLAQFHPLEEALAAMGVAVWPMVELEADDGLASARTRPRRTSAWRRSASGRRTRTSRSASRASA